MAIRFPIGLDAGRNGVQPIPLKSGRWTSTTTGAGDTPQATIAQLDAKHSCATGCSPRIVRPTPGSECMGATTRAWIFLGGGIAVYVVAVAFILPGRVCICVKNDGSKPVAIDVTTPNGQLRFESVGARTQSCRGMHISREGSIDVQDARGQRLSEYVDDNMTGDLIVHFAASDNLKYRVDSDRLGILGWPSCW